MGKITRYIGNLVAFASGSLTTERTVFGDTAQSDDLTANINTDFLRGWTNGVDANGFPPEQYFNAIGFTATQLAAYLHQMGLPEWDNLQDFQTDSVTQRNGKIYISLAPNNIGNDPTSDLVNWFDLFQAIGISFDDSVVSFTATHVQAAIEELGTLVDAIDPVTINTISGLVTSNGTDALNDIDISLGQARDSLDSLLMSLSTVMTKQIDAPWVAGTNLGGLFSGVVAADTWYAVHLIRKDSDGSIDAGFDTSAVAANIPAGYTSYRRIGWVLTDASANIYGFTAREESGGKVVHYWSEEKPDVNRIALTTRTLEQVSAPPNSTVILKAKNSGAFSEFLWIREVTFLDVVADAFNSMLTTSSTSSKASVMVELFVNSSSQIASRSSTANDTIKMSSNGFIDGRIS